MRLSTQGRFTVNPMVDVALRKGLGPVPLNDIASRQHILLPYLEQVSNKLRLRRLVTSMRGPGGGYSIGRRIDGISAADIFCAVEGSSNTKQPIPRWPDHIVGTLAKKAFRPPFQACQRRVAMLGSSPSPILPTRAEDRLILLDEIDFKWLLTGLGLWIDLPRYRTNPTYAAHFLGLAEVSESIALRECAASLRRIASIAP